MLRIQSEPSSRAWSRVIPILIQNCRIPVREGCRDPWYLPEKVPDARAAPPLSPVGHGLFSHGWAPHIPFGQVRYYEVPSGAITRTAKHPAARLTSMVSSAH